VPRNDGAPVPLMAALAWQGVEAVRTLDGAPAAAVLRADGAEVLGPTLVPGAIIVMDNLRAHHVTGMGERIAARGAPLRYLPPDAPDLAPITPCWVKLKPLWRAAPARTREAREAAIPPVWAAVMPSDARGWFRPGSDA
jgi:transposase